MIDGTPPVFITDVTADQHSLDFWISKINRGAVSLIIEYCTLLDFLNPGGVPSIHLITNK